MVFFILFLLVVNACAPVGGERAAWRENVLLKAARNVKSSRGLMRGRTISRFDAGVILLARRAYATAACVADVLSSSFFGADGLLEAPLDRSPAVPL
jgi:hypothetical protein